MANISTLTVSLVADTAKFSNGLKKSRKDASNFSKGLKTAFKAAGIAAAVFGAALIGLVKSSLALVDQQRKTARTLGTTQAVFAGLSLAAGIAGVSTESFSKALKRQAKSIVDANDGLQTQARAFERLKLNTQELIKLPVEEQFKKITTARGTVENSTLKVAIASDIFGAKNADLINILELGEAGLQGFIDKAKELGVALTEDQTAAIEQANDSVLIFKTSITGLGNQLAARFAPLISAGAEALAGFVSRVTKLVPKLFAFTAGLFGIRRELSELVLVDIAEEIKVVDAEILDLQGTLKGFQKIVAQNPAGTLGTALAIPEIQRQLDEAVQRYNDLIRRGLELKKIAQATVIGGPEAAEDEEKVELIDLKSIRALRMEVTPELEAFRDRVKQAKAEAARIFEATRTPIQRFVIDMGKAREALLLGDLSKEDFETFRQGLLDSLVGTEEDFENFTDNLTTFADQAARNMQDAFSDFFFSGFKDGLDGLVSSFGDTLRRMVSELIASDLLNLIKGLFSQGGGGGGGIFGFIGSLFGRQIGGPVKAGQSVIVGESGREVFTPGASGSVRPLGAINFAPVTNINGGAGLDITRLIPILEENNRKVKGEFVDELRRGQFA
jgi:hypothetical protein